MSKRNRHSGEIKTPGMVVSLLPALQKAKESDTAPRIYANHVRFSVNSNEIIIDLYRIESEFATAETPQAFLLQRVFIPHGLGKGFATALANAIARFEKAIGTNFPNNREPDPEDIINIWKEE